jgi:bifunctional ADP-heptose synthase (sugar kinase/adenylyltransferase)
MATTDKLTDVRVLCVGDVMLDRFVSGQVKRISPESPVPILSISGTKSFPGGAANVARNVASLGGLCSWSVWSGKTESHASCGTQTWPNAERIVLTNFPVSSKAAAVGSRAARERFDT